MSDKLNKNISNLIVHFFYLEELFTFRNINKKYRTITTNTPIMMSSMHIFKKYKYYVGNTEKNLNFLELNKELVNLPEKIKVMVLNFICYFALFKNNKESSVDLELYKGSHESLSCALSYSPSRTKITTLLVNLNEMSLFNLVSDQIPNYPTIKALILKYSKDDYFENIEFPFQHFGNKIEELYILNNNYVWRNSPVRFISSFKRLLILSVKYMNLNDDNFKIFNQNIKEIFNLRKIELYECQIKPSVHLEQFFTIIIDFNNLTCLNLENNKLGLDGVRLLYDHLHFLNKETRISELNISLNEIMDEGLNLMWELIFNFFKNLKIFKCCLNRISPMGFKALNSKVSTPSLEILHLNFFNNYNEGKMDFLNLFKTVKELELSHSYLSEEGFKELCDNLKEMNNLSKLKISGNNIKDFEFKYLLKSLKCTESLNFIDIRFNLITKGSLNSLYELLLENTTIMFDLSKNEICDHIDKEWQIRTITRQR
jgi:Ran GTPase-activating protein (RanGAP) involved in mRNA processing and transport